MIKSTNPKVEKLSAWLDENIIPSVYRFKITTNSIRKLVSQSKIHLEIGFNEINELLDYKGYVSTDKNKIDRHWKANLKIQEVVKDGEEKSI